MWQCARNAVDWKRYSPEDQCFSSISPKNNNSLCHNCPTRLSHKCPTHLSHECPIPISRYVLTSHFMYVQKQFSYNEHRCASWCWCSPTRHSWTVTCNFRPPSGDPDGAYIEGRSRRCDASSGSQVATGRGWLPYQRCKYSHQTGQFGAAVGPPTETGAGEVRFSMVTYLVPFHTCVWVLSS